MGLIDEILLTLTYHLKTNVMKRILVPVDFSKEAESAAKVAASIAKKTGSEIFLVHMLELPVTTIDPAEMNTMSSEPQIIYFMKLAHQKFEKFKKLPFFKGITVVETIQFQHAFSGIINESEKNNIDLIVMGSQGASGLQEMFIGSNTEKVVRRSNVPVLVIKQSVKDFVVNDIIFASDFNKESKSTFHRVINFAELFDAKIHLLYINTIHNFNTTKTIESRIAHFMDDFDYTNYTTNIYNDISIEKGILSFARDIDADLIALNTHGRSGLSQLFNGSVGQELANHALRPVVTFKI
jgi:nucleotide-binding universal stress UspA family protein